MGFLTEWYETLKLLFGKHEKAIATIPPGTSFAGKTIIVTGASSGLGLAAAITYVQLGAAKVYITTRNASKGAEAKVTIEERTGKKDVLEVRILDMDTFEGVKVFVDGIKRDLKTIGMLIISDIVLLNAGIHAFTYQTLPDGWESDIQVNVLSTTLLALLLLQWMQEVKKPDQIQHMTFTGSGAHINVDITASKFPKQDILNYSSQKLNFEHGQSQYGVSKLLLMYATRELANLAVDDAGKLSPIVNSVCPGLIKTDISRGFRDKGLIFKWIEAAFMALKASSPEDGAKTLVVATTTDDHGKFRRPYMTDEQYNEAAKRNVTSTEGQKMQAKVWKEIIGVLQEKDSEISKIAKL